MSPAYDGGGGGLAWGDVVRWRSAPLRDMEKTLKHVEDLFVRAADDAAEAARVDGWGGEAAIASGELRSRIERDAQEHVMRLGYARRAVGIAADDVSGVEHAVRTAHDAAAAHEVSVAASGLVTDTKVPPTNLSAHDSEVYTADRTRATQQVAALVSEALRRVEAIDLSLAQALGTIAEHRVAVSATAMNWAEADAAGGGQLSDAVAPPPSGGAPASNAAWWQSMSEHDQADVLAHHPEWVGNLDGIPASVRDSANRSRIPGLRADAQAHIADLRKQMHDVARMPVADGASNSALLLDLQGQLGHYEERLKALDAIDHTLERSQRHLLTLDESGERVKAAVAIGDVDSADHVSVFVPGTTANVPDSMERYDEQMRQLQRRAKSGLLPGQTSAVVTWIGYEAPQLGSDPVEIAYNLLIDDDRVTSRDSAVRGGQTLNGFLNGLDASRTGPPSHLSLLGHSYGSLVASHALQGGTPVDDVALFGSPGADVNSADDLHVRSNHAYHLAYQDDPIDQLANGPQLVENLRVHYGDDAVRSFDSAVRSHLPVVPGVDPVAEAVSDVVQGVSDRVVDGVMSPEDRRRATDDFLRSRRPFGVDLDEAPGFVQTPVAGGYEVHDDVPLVGPRETNDHLSGQPDKGILDIHSSYLDERSQAQYQLSRILAGRPDLMSRVQRRHAASIFVPHSPEVP